MFFSKYNFVISYQSGKKNKKANALTWKPNKQLVDTNNKKLEHHMQALLPLKYFEHVVNLQPIEVENKNPLDATTLVDPAEPHKKPHGINAEEHGPELNRILMLPKEVKEAN